MTDNDELVERVARVLCEDDGYNPDALPVDYEDQVQQNAVGPNFSRYKAFAQSAISAIRPGDTYGGMMWVPVGASPRMSGIDLAVRFSEHAARNDGRLVITHNFRDLDRAAVLHLSPRQLSDIYAAMLKALKGDE